MKYMIVSDIHGDADCTDKFLRIFDEEKCDRLVILGDILYHGPRNDLPSGYNPKRVILALNSISDKITAVKGNCDAEVDEAVLNFEIFPSPYYTDLNGIKTVLTHVRERVDLNKKAALLLCSHTHVLCAEREPDGTVVINPGSVSIPRSGNPSTFAVLNGGEIKIFDFNLSLIKSLEI